MSKPITTKEVNIPPITVPTSSVIVPEMLTEISGNMSIVASSTGGY